MTMATTASDSELANFLAHSVELESEARERYGELADSMDAHHNRLVAEFFRRMAAEAEHHLQEVAELARDMTLPQLKAWEFDWPDAEPPETASYEALHYRMSLRQAMELALANEHAAQRYYRQFANRSGDAETIIAANRFADEELGHAVELERMIAALPENGLHLLEEDDEPHMPE
jgi:rubrerythrin